MLEVLKSLPLGEKKLLVHLIKKCNKDGISRYNGPFINVQYLFERKLLVQNNLYKGEGISIFVLPDAPYLLRVLSRWRKKVKEK
jgi:hypothetical protein